MSEEKQEGFEPIITSRFIVNHPLIPDYLITGVNSDGPYLWLKVFVEKTFQISRLSEAPIVDIDVSLLDAQGNITDVITHKRAVYKYIDYTLDLKKDDAMVVDILYKKGD